MPKIGRVAELFSFNLALIYQTVHIFSVLYVYNDKSSGVCYLVLKLNLQGAQKGDKKQSIQVNVYIHYGGYSPEKFSLPLLQNSNRVNMFLH